MKKFLLSILFVFLISCTIITQRMPKESSKMARLINNLTINAGRSAHLKNEIFNSFDYLLPNDTNYVTTYPYNQEIVYESEDIYLSIIGNVKNENKENKDKKIMFIVNGGAFYHEQTSKHKDLYSKILEKLNNNNFDIVAVKYTSLYKENYPYQINQIEKSLNYLKNIGYSLDNMIIIGDSAGGNLILSTVLKMRDNNEKLPRMLILYSPWTDLTNTTESRFYNRYRDIAMGTSDDYFNDFPDALINNDYGKGEDLTNPYISPIFGDYKGFPTTVIEVGSYEMLFDDSYKIYQNMKKNNVNVKFYDAPGMFHVYVYYETRETQESFMRVAKYIEEEFNYEK